MPIGAIGGALTGISAIAGLFGKKQKQVTTPSYSPEQQALQSAVSGKLRDRLDNPANLDPLQTAATAGVNRAYDSADTSLTAKLAAKGFGNSGKLVTNSKNLAIAKAGAQGSLESQFAALKLDQENKTLDMAGNFGFRNPTTTTEGTAGGGVGGAVGGGAETASLLFALNHFLSGGKAPGGGGGSGSGEAGSEGGGWFSGGAGDFGGEE